MNASMLIDSGAEHTVLARNNPALPTMAAHMGKRGAAQGMSSVGTGLVIDDVPVTFAGTTLQLRAVVLPASQICGEGLLGADVLHQCKIVWGRSSLWAACRS